MAVPAGLNQYANSLSISPSASISPSYFLSGALTVIQQLQQNSLINSVSNGNTFNAKYTPQVPHTFVSGGWGASGVDYEIPTGKTPTDRLKRALIIASSRRYFWDSSCQLLPAYAPKYTRHISRLNILKETLRKEITTVSPDQGKSDGDFLYVDIYTMAIRVRGSSPAFTCMMFRPSNKCATAISVDVDDDMLTLPNSLLFVASQHKEFSIGIVQCQGEEGGTLKAVKEFLDGFCDINIKPLMERLVYEHMGSVIFLAPSKRIASLAKALFNIKYVDVMSMFAHKDERVMLPVPSNTYGYGTVGGGALLGATPWSTTISGSTLQPSAYTVTDACSTSKNSNITWTKLQDSISKMSNSMTSATNSLKNYFSSNDASS